MSEVQPSLLFVPRILSPRHLKVESLTFCGSAAQNRVSRVVEKDSSLRFSQRIVQAAKSSQIASLLPINWNLVGVRVAQVAEDLQRGTEERSGGGGMGRESVKHD